MDARIPIWDKRERSIIKGDDAPLESELEDYLKKKPWCVRHTNQKEPTGKKKSKKASTVSAVAGTRDFPPKDLALRNWLFGIWRDVAKAFAFEEYDAPILERQELYKRKAGEDITKEMYGFTDKEDQEICLRPEMTPSLARIVIAQGKALLMPIRWFSIPQCWRFEAKTVRGRKREHFQWNMDVFGVKDITAEAELLAAIVEFFKRVGLTPEIVKIRLSSRRLIECVLKKFGVSAKQFGPVCIAVDKLDKLSPEEVVEMLKGLGVVGETSEKIIAVLSIKDDFDAVVKIAGEGVADAAVNELRELWRLAEAYGFVEYLQFDASVVRGLAYYTGVVFEAFTQRGELRRAICGGGRYEKLLSLYGGQDQPAVGFGFGDVVILEVLRDEGLLPDLSSRVDDVVFAQRDDLRPVAIRAANQLRAQGRSVDIIMERKKKMKQLYSYADRVGAARVILVAPDEWANEEVRVKDLRKTDGEEGKQYNVKLSALE